MDIVKSTVLQRKGKKWKSRWAVFRKLAAVPDPCEASMLMLFKHPSDKRPKKIHPLWKYAGCLTFTRVEKAENVLMIFIEHSTIVLAFDTQRLLNDWYHAFQVQFGKEVTYPVTIPPKQKLKAGDSTLFIYDNYFSIINDKSYRCVGRWTSSELGNCESIDGDFLFEVSRHDNWKRNTYRLKTDKCDDIIQIFDYIKENSPSGGKETLRSSADTGSEFIIDMERERSHSLDSSSAQSVFQRAFLRISNRFRKRSRAHTAVVGKQKRQERLRQLNQPSSSNGNGSANEVDARRAQASAKGYGGQITTDLNKKTGSASHEGRSNSHVEFSSDSGRHARIKARGKSEPLHGSVIPLKAVNDNTTVSHKHIASTSGRLKSSVGSASMVSSRSRGLSSTTSDVFTDDIMENDSRPKQNGPPVAPPRSPASLGLFTFPDSPDGKSGEESEYLNKEGIDELTGRTSSSIHKDSFEVILRPRAEESSLLDEIDREIKRRTREEDVPSTPLSCTSVDGPNSFDYYDREESENYVMLRTTDTGPSVDMTSNQDNQTQSRKQSTEVAPGMTREAYPLLNGNLESDQTVKQTFNPDPGVHSPNALESSGEEAAYQNVSEIIGNRREAGVGRGRRNSSRRSSSKHLSDPLLTERLGHIQQWHNDNVASSLRELPNQTNYVNCQGKNENDSKPSSYVNFNVGGAPQRTIRKKKPSPLNFNFEKYDDEENIYHNVGPLLTDRSDSVDGLGSYKNIGAGSYENMSGRNTPRNNRAYVNVPSPSHKKFVPMLNYVLVSGSKGSMSQAYRGERSGSLNSVNSDKSDKVNYSIIDEKATILLQKTRDQHWQQRAEDGQAKLNTPRTKKSFGD